MVFYCPFVPLPLNIIPHNSYYFLSCRRVHGKLTHFDFVCNSPAGAGIRSVRIDRIDTVGGGVGVPQSNSTATGLIALPSDWAASISPATRSVCCIFPVVHQVPNLSFSLSFYRLLFSRIKEICFVFHLLLPSNRFALSVHVVIGAC